MNETDLNGKLTVEISALDEMPEEELEHSIKSAWSYAKKGHVDYTLQCLQEADESSMKLGKHIDEKIKNPILRVAYKRGVKRQLEYVKRYAVDEDTRDRDSCLNSAEEFRKGILKCQRSLKEIKSTLGNKIFYKLRYYNVSDEELQEKFNNEGKIYDSRIKADYKKMSKNIENAKKRLTENKPHGLMGLLGRFRKPSEVSIQEEKAIPTKDIIPYLRKMSSEIYESSPEMMLELSYKWAQDDAESGNVASVKANIENIKKYSRELGAFTQDHELEHILSTSYKNGVDAALKKAKRHAQRGIFSKAKAELDEAKFYASNINSSIPTEDADSILKTAYTKGLSKMLDRSARMAEKGKAKAAAKALKLSQECADYIKADISQKRDEILDTAYSNEIVRVFSKAKKNADLGMFDAVKRALKTIELDANHVKRSVQTQKKNYLLRTAAKNGVLIELEKAEIRHDAGEEAYVKRHLKKAEKLADEILNYQRSVNVNYQRRMKEIKSSIHHLYNVLSPYGNFSNEELQKRFDGTVLKYDIKTIKEQEKLKEKVEKTKNKLLNQNIIYLKV